MRTEDFIPAALAALLGLSANELLADTPETTAPIRLTLTMTKSNPVTTITVAGQSVQAGVDTGGNALVLTKELLDRAGATPLKETLDATDALGHKGKKPTYRVPALMIGGHTFTNLVAVAAAETGGPPIPNWLGRLFLHRFTVVLDYAGGVLILWPAGAANPAGCGTKRIPVQQTAEPYLAVGDFVTSSGRLRLLWDTGANYSAVPEPSAQERGLPTAIKGPGSPRFWRTGSLTAGGQDYGALEFVILPLRLPRDFDGLLGRNFFEQHVVCLDYKRREVRVR